MCEKCRTIARACDGMIKAKLIAEGRMPCCGRKAKMPLQDIDTELKKAEFELVAAMLRECNRYKGDIEPTNEILTLETDSNVIFVLPKGGSVTINPDGTWDVTT